MTKGEKPGNAVHSARAFEDFIRSVGIGWLECVRAFERLERDGIELKRISIKGDFTHGVGVLVVMTANAPGGAIVAFHQGDDLQMMWRGLAARIMNGSLKWKEDQYA